MTLLSLVLPVHNEEAIIETVFKKIFIALKKINTSFEIILVENGSRDNSLDAIQKLCKKFPNTKVISSKIGYTRAIKAGIKIAKGKYVCYMPSDGQANEHKIEKLFKLITENDYDIVKVKRVSRENIIRYIVSISFDLAICLIFHTKFIDINGSPRIMLREKYNMLNIKSDDSFGDSEMLIKATLLNWSIKEIPMQNIQRYGGKSTRSIKTFLEFFRNIYIYKTSSIIPKWNKAVNEFGKN